MHTHTPLHSHTAHVGARWGVASVMLATSSVPKIKYSNGQQQQHTSLVSMTTPHTSLMIFSMTTPLTSLQRHMIFSMTTPLTSLQRNMIFPWPHPSHPYKGTWYFHDHTLDTDVYSPAVSTTGTLFGQSHLWGARSVGVLKLNPPPPPPSSWPRITRDRNIWKFTVISLSYHEMLLADTKLIEFCKMFEDLYGKTACTPNMHLHAHLRNVY